LGVFDWNKFFRTGPLKCVVANDDAECSAPVELAQTQARLILVT